MGVHHVGVHSVGALSMDVHGVEAHGASAHNMDVQSMGTQCAVVTRHGLANVKCSYLIKSSVKSGSVCVALVVR